MGAVQIQRRAHHPASTAVLERDPSRRADRRDGPLPSRRDEHIADRHALSGYTLHEVIGAGGSSTVYLATHTPSDGSDPRPVALKLLKPQGSAGEAQLFHELRVLQSIDHPNVVEVLDFGRSPSGAPWMAFEHVPGVQLRALLRDGGPFDLPRAHNLMRQLLSALDAAHAQQVVHLDLKPSNILITRDDDGHEHLKLLDFGLARCIDRLDHWDQTPHGSSVGTPRYMAPELLRGDAVGPFCDIYAAGLIFFELLTATPAIVGASPHEVIVKQLLQPLRWPAHLRCPDLDMLLDATTHKDWTERVPDASIFLQALNIIDPNALADSLRFTHSARAALRRPSLSSTQIIEAETATNGKKTNITNTSSENLAASLPSAFVSTFAPALAPIPITTTPSRRPKPTPQFTPRRHITPLDLSLEIAQAQAITRAQETPLLAPSLSLLTPSPHLLAPEPTCDTFTPLCALPLSCARPPARSPLRPHPPLTHPPTSSHWSRRALPALPALPALFQHPSLRPFARPPLYVPMLLTMSAVLLALGLYL
jgi:serine/threonine protein kinase